MKRAQRIIAILLLSFLFHSCAEFQEIRVDSPSAIKINGLKDRKLNIDVFLPIRNPNNIRFKITRIDLKIIVNDSYLGKITGIDNILIQPNSSEIHKFNLDLEITSITSGIISLVNIFGDRQVDVETSGYIKIRSGFIFKTIQVKDKTRVEVEMKLPVIR